MEGKENNSKIQATKWFPHLFGLDLKATKNFLMHALNQRNHHIKITAGKMLRFKKRNTTHCMLPYSIFKKQLFIILKSKLRIVLISFSIKSYLC